MPFLSAIYDLSSQCIRHGMTFTPVPPAMHRQDWSVSNRLILRQAVEP